MPSPTDEPPLQFLPDLVAGSEMDIALLVSSKTRTGLVTGISGDASTALEQVLACPGMPALGSSVVVAGRTLYLRNIKAQATQQDTARVQLIYDNDFGANAQSAYLIRSNAYLSSYETNLVPGTRVPMRIGLYTDPVHGFNTIPPDNVTFRFQRVTREIEVSGIKFGNPPTDDHYEQWVGYANADVFKNLKTGYWVITNGGTSFSKYSGFYKWNLSAITRNTEDWSETGILTDKRTGRHVDVKPEDVAALNALPYAYGIIGQPNGMIRVGPYPVTSFAPLFGFSNTGIGNALDGLLKPNTNDTSPNNV